MAVDEAPRKREASPAAHYPEAGPGAQEEGQGQGGRRRRGWPARKAPVPVQKELSFHFSWCKDPAQPSVEHRVPKGAACDWLVAPTQPEREQLTRLHSPGPAGALRESRHPEVLLRRAEQDGRDVGGLQGQSRAARRVLRVEESSRDATRAHRRCSAARAMSTTSRSHPFPPARARTGRRTASASTSCADGRDTDSGARLTRVAAYQMFALVKILRVPHTSNLWYQKVR